MAADIFSKGRLFAACALLALACNAAADGLPTRFEVGGYSVNLMPSRENVTPTVSFAGRAFSFAYRTDGGLMDGTRRLAFNSAQTNVLSGLSRAGNCIKADYVHSLYAGKDGERRLVGMCSNEVVFAGGEVTVRATLFPAEPGRYRFHRSSKASQVIVFANFAKRWTGTTLQLFASKDVSFMNELMPHDRYDPDAWGMNLNTTGYAMEMVLGNVPDIIRFTGTGGARFACNRYRGGFEASAVLLNEDVMHKPVWNGPVVLTYEIKMTK